MAEQSTTLCWSCKYACGKCPWSECDKETRELRWQKVFCERQYTRRQIADAVGISKSNVWWWLSGNNQHTIDVIKGILRESGLTFEEAFGGAE